MTTRTAGTARAHRSRRRARVLEIIDDGPGIASEDRPTVARELAHAHGGDRRRNRGSDRCRRSL